MAESIPKQFVCSWGSIKYCHFHITFYKGSGLTEIMMIYDDLYFYCAKCFEDFTDEQKNFVSLLSMMPNSSALKKTVTQSYPFANFLLETVARNR